MKVACQKLGSVDVLVPDGPLTEDIADVFRAVADRPMSAPNPRVVVAMGAVAFMDSAGLEMLLDYAGAFHERNLSLKLAALPATCREILNLTNAQSEFEMFDDVQDAVRSFL